MLDSTCSTWWRRSAQWHRRALLLGVVTAALSSTGCGDTGGSDDGDSKNTALCRAPAWVSGSPQTIEDVTSLINALAQEHGGTVDLPCFVSSVSRPLGAAGSSSFVSAQPAAGPRSPRMFLWSGALVMSVAPEGIGAGLLELGYQTTPTRSIKAEIPFPVKAPLSFAAPYDRVLNQTQTSCSSCHPHEEPAASITWATAFESEVLRISDDDVVDLGYVTRESERCDPAAEPERCALLGAIFGQGNLHAQAFSREALTIYGD